MQRVVKYISALGREYDNPEMAMADEDRLPRIIATYERDLSRYEAGKTFANELLTEESAARYRASWQRSINDYKEKWAEVQAQRAAPVK